jgi:hypothetical protein
MTTDEFHQLLRDFCLASGLSDPERLIATGIVRVAGMDMLIRHDALADPASLELRMDFGPLPQKKREAMTSGLLQTNFFIASYASFCLHPTAGHVVLTMRVPTQPSFAGKDLLQVLHKASAEGSMLWEKMQGQLLTPLTADGTDTIAKSRLMHVLHGSKG